MAEVLPSATQSELKLPAPIPNALRVLASTRNPLLDHFDACFERLTYLAECQATFNDSERTHELESAVKEMIDCQEDANNTKDAIISTAHWQEVGQSCEETSHSIFERLEVLKTNYRDLTEPAKYGHAKAYEEFKRRIFDIEHPDDDYPGTMSFFGNRNTGEEELEMTYHTKRSLKCPITMTTFQHPMRSKVCVHIYSRDAVMEMLSRNRWSIQCPVAGCDKIITRDVLERDKVTERRVRDEEEDEEQQGEELSSEAGGSDVLDVL